MVADDLVIGVRDINRHMSPQMYVEIFKRHRKYVRALQRTQAFRGPIKRAIVPDPIQISLSLRLG